MNTRNNNCPSRIPAIKASANKNSHICILNTPTFYALRMNFRGQFFFCTNCESSSKVCKMLGCSRCNFFKHHCEIQFDKDHLCQTLAGRKKLDISVAQPKTCHHSAGDGVCRVLVPLPGSSLGIKWQVLGCATGTHPNFASA